jgi:hypothetical protein
MGQKVQLGSSLPAQHEGAGIHGERWNMFLSTKRGVGRAAMVLMAATLSISGLGLALAGPASAKTTVAATSASLGHPGAKAAPAGASDCPANALCMWENPNFTGTGIYDTLGQKFPSGACAALPTDWNDRISSLVNTSDRNLVFYVDANCKGASFIMPPGTQLPNLGSFDEKVTTVKL